MPRSKAPLILLVLVQLVVFLLSLPGVGIETRTPAQYAPWAGPIFLAFTLAVFVFGFASLAAIGRRPRMAAGLAILQGLVALATNLLDISHVGGPAPPQGPLILGIVSMVVALGEIGVAMGFGRGPRTVVLPGVGG